MVLVAFAVATAVFIMVAPGADLLLIFLAFFATVLTALDSRGGDVDFN